MVGMLASFLLESAAEATSSSLICQRHDDIRHRGPLDVPPMGRWKGATKRCVWSWICQLLYPKWKETMGKSWQSDGTGVQYSIFSRSIYWKCEDASNCCHEWLVQRIYALLFVHCRLAKSFKGYQSSDGMRDGESFAAKIMMIATESWWSWL